MGTRDEWANIGRGFRDLGTKVGKTVVKTVKAGTQKIEDWAYEDDNNASANNTQKQEPVAEATVVDDNQK